MWNNHNPSYGGPPPAFNLHGQCALAGSDSQSSGGFSMPEPHPGYNPGSPPSYRPLPGPPPPLSYNAPLGPPPPGQPRSGFRPPAGPPPLHYGPPPGPPPGDREYPGQQYRQQHQRYLQGGYPRQQTHSGYPGQHTDHGGNLYRQGPPPPPPTHVQTYGPQNNENVQHFFQHSQCTGKKKALCIGINYFGQGDMELKGCINDANNIQKFLCTYYGYKKEDIVMLTDDSTNPRMMPTKENMLQAMQWLVCDASPHDSLFFHYSGHGGQTKDLGGDEADGFDEVIYPMDFAANGHIVDDLMHHIMVKPLPVGCRLTALFDSCHSGTALDLPYVYSTQGKIKEPNLVAEAGQKVLSAVTSYAQGDMNGVMRSAVGLVQTATGHSRKAERITQATRTSPADVISWSGCKDSQTSTDTEEGGQATGAMSFAFISVLSANTQQSYHQVLIGIRELLKNKFVQKPQLSSSHPMDTNILFIC